MKLQNVTKLTLAVLIATQMLNVEAAVKAPKKLTQILHTKQKEALEDPYYQIKSVKIRELTSEESLKYVHEESSIPKLNTKGFVGPNIPNIPPVPPSKTGESSGEVTATTADGPAPSTKGTLDNIIMVVDKLIAVGQKLIPMIKDGKAIVTNNPMTAISVLPRTDAKDPAVHDMGGWTIPVSKHYKITYSNGFGAEVVSFVYSITFQYNGSADGKGKYLAGVRASARDITIDWGFDLDASSQLIQISNVGTQQNVIAGATIEMSYAVKNWTRTISTSTSFFVSGDGKLYKLD
jgi:hypothetical protein